MSWELPDDPAEREKVRAAVRSEAQMVLAAASVLAARLPPGRPLSSEETTALQEPLEDCLAKWTHDMTPEWKLVAAVAGIVAVRWMEVQLAGFLPTPPAGKREVKGEAQVVVA